MTKEQRYSAIGYLLISVLAVFTAGCTSGGEDTGPSDGTTNTDVPNSGAAVTVDADPGPIDVVQWDTSNNVVTLNGVKSISSSPNPLTFNWSFIHKPDGSNSQLSNFAAEQPTFVADAKGIYTVQLVVSAGGVSSTRGDP